MHNRKRAEVCAAQYKVNVYSEMEYRYFKEVGCQ